MAKDGMDVLELLGKEAPEADLDFLRNGLRVLVQAVMGAAVTTKAGASCGRARLRLASYPFCIGP